MDLFVVIMLSVLEIFALLIGTLIVFSTKNNNKVMTFSVSLGFVVLILLGCIHLLPEAYEVYTEKFSNTSSILLMLAFSLLGFGIILVLDKLGGHHDHHEHEHNEEGHFKHISLITCIFLVIHNFIEGITLYSAVLTSYETAAILTLGIALHNVPLGFTLSSTFNKIYSNAKTLLYVVLIGCSYLLGALVLYKINYVLLSPMVLGSLLTFTFGMIVYIAVYEFLPLLAETKETRIRNIGIISGILTMLLTLFI